MPVAPRRELTRRVRADTFHNQMVDKGRKEGPKRFTCYVLADGTVLGSPEALEARELQLKLDEKLRIANVLRKARVALAEKS